jgi:serine protease Do
MKLFTHSHTARIALAALVFAPFSFAEDAPKTDAKMPAVKVDPSPLPQVAGTISTFAPVVEKVGASVVTVSTSKLLRRGQQQQNPLLNDPMFRRFFGIPDPGEDEAPSPRGGRGNRRQSIGLGSGVIVSAEGHILTNNHVIEGADEILVTLANSKQEHKAKRIGTDPGTDIALLKIDVPNVRAITFADSDKLKVGDVAIAVGNPFGLAQSVTMGIVSALGRNTTGITDYENFIQTDASINPGNSGGALVDAEGRLIGINTAIFSRTGGNQGIGFAVPANLARSVMESILKNGRVTRGFLGIGLQPVTEELAESLKTGSTSGALVNEVQPNSPAEKAGVTAGDVVVEVDGKKIEGPRELQLLVGSLAPGTKVNVKLLREGKEKAVSVELAERPGAKIADARGSDQAEDPDVLDGVTVADLDPELRKQFEIPDSVRSGVVVTKIDADSPSAEAGIRIGDVILEVNRVGVGTSKQAVELSEKLKKEKKVMLRVSTKGTPRFVVVERKE